MNQLQAALCDHILEFVEKLSLLAGNEFFCIVKTGSRRKFAATSHLRNQFVRAGLFYREGDTESSAVPPSFLPFYDSPDDGGQFDVAPPVRLRVGAGEARKDKEVESFLRPGVSVDDFIKVEPVSTTVDRNSGSTSGDEDEGACSIKESQDCPVRVDFPGAAFLKDRKKHSRALVKAKRPRTALTFGTKRKIIQMLDAGEKPTKVCRLFGLQSSTISTIKKQRETILKSVNLNRVRETTPLHYEIENRLILWVREHYGDGAVFGPAVRAKAMEIAKTLDYPEGAFNANPGWLQRFKNRYNLRGAINCSEMAMEKVLTSIDCFQ